MKPFIKNPFYIPATRDNGTAVSYDVRREQAIASRRATPVSIGIASLFALLVYLSHLGQASFVLANIWLAAVFVPAPYLFYLWYKNEGYVREGEEAKVHRRVLITGIYMGAVWGSASVIFFSLDSIPHLISLAMAIGCLTAAAAGVLHFVPLSTLLFMVPTLVPFAFLFLREGTVPHLVSGFLVLLYGGLLVIVSYTGFWRFVALVKARNDGREARTDLLDALESSSEAFGFFDENGVPILLNGHFKDMFKDNWPQMRPGEERVHQLADGRWVISSTRKTRRDGLVSVHADITAIKEQEDALRQARDAAEAANRTKSMFLATMSHELRTPLNAVIGFAELIVMKTRDEERGAKNGNHEYAQNIAKAGKHLLSIINDILDLSKIEAGEYGIESDVIDLSEVLDTVITMVEPEARKDGVTLMRDLPEEGPFFIAGRRAIDQILINLISNAIKFTESGGEVRIGAKITEDAFEIFVEDTGVGISEDNLEAVLEPFIQVDNGLSRAAGGTGLGLTLVQHLSRLHGGEFVLESTLNIGTRARVILPANCLCEPGPNLRLPL